MPEETPGPFFECVSFSGLPFLACPPYPNACHTSLSLPLDQPSRLVYFHAFLSISHLRFHAGGRPMLVAACMCGPSSFGQGTEGRELDVKRKALLLPHHQICLCRRRFAAAVSFMYSSTYDPSRRRNLLLAGWLLGRFLIASSIAPAGESVRAGWGIPWGMRFPTCLPLCYGRGGAPIDTGRFTLVELVRKGSVIEM